MANNKKAGVKVLTPAALAKKYKGSGKASDVVVPADKNIWIPSKMIAFNYLTGGGLMYGKIMELFGEESSGKSLLALDIAYCAQQLGGMILWADSEHAFTAAWAEANGLDLDKIELYQETGVEPISDWIADMCIYYRSILTNNEPILLIVDSTAALDCVANIDSSQVEAKAEMGNRAKALYKLFRIRNELLSDLGISSIWINQLRAKVGASKFENPDTTPGGKALAFFAAIRIGIYGGKQIKAKINGYESRVGRHVSIRVIKNKLAPPRETIKGAEVYTNPEYESFDVGFYKYFGIANVLLRTRVLKKKKGASRFYYKDKMIANGETALIKAIEKDDKLRARLIKKSGVNTISKTRKQIKSITENQFPVINTKFDSQEDIKDEE